MDRLIICLIGIFFSAPKPIVGELINRSIANVYLQPEEDTQIDYQVIYGSVVEIVDRRDDWSKVRLEDGGEGWVLSCELITNPSYENNEQLRPVKNLYAHIYRVTDTTPYPPLLTLPYGTWVKLDEIVDKGERWVPIELISGEKAWIQRGDIDFSPKPKTLEEILTFSQKFLGLPYTWGGTSSFGFDCSGFIQMLFKEMGLQIPRNSREQAACDLFISVSEEELEPGDLVFFGESRITHVGLYLGNDEYIHSGTAELPILMISHMKNGKYHFLAGRRVDSNKIKLPH